MNGSNTKRPMSPERKKKLQRRRRKRALLLTALVIIALAFIATLVILCITLFGADGDGSSAEASDSSFTDFSETDGSGDSSEPDAPEESSAEPEESLPPTEAYEKYIGVEYAIDMTDYEAYVDPEDDEQYVFLVNPAHPLSKDFVPENLTTCTHMRAGQPTAWSKLNSVANEALKAFLAEAEYYGFDDITVTNGYRSYASQSSLFNTYVSRDIKQDWYCDNCSLYIDVTYDKDKFSGSTCAACKGALRRPTLAETETHVCTYSTRPGTSEHQSGLCLDMHNLPEATNAFNDTPEAKWLAENAHRFGFILRYPPDTQHITGIKHESWHFRFVGRDTATYLYENNLTLDEYLAD